MPPASDPTTRPRPPWLPWLGLAVAVVVAYANSFNVPFLLDDEVSLRDNDSLLDLTDLRAVLFPPTEVFTAGRPLLNLSFAVNRALTGPSPAGFHAVNLAIHLAAVLVLAGLVRRTLLLPGFSGRFNRTAVWIGPAAALLWGVHPVLTESVTYLSQRAEALMGLCYMGTLYAFVRSLERPGRWSVVAVGVCGAGMLVKEVMVTAPLAVFLLDAAFAAGSCREAWRRRRGFYLGLAATWLVLAALMAGTRLQDRGVGYGIGYSWHEYFRIECGTILLYLRLAVFPAPLVFDYGELVPVPAPAAWLTAAGVLAAGVAAMWFGWRRHRGPAYLGICFLLTLAPTSSVVPVVGQPIAENRLYLPLIAVSTVLAAGLVQTAGRRATVLLVAIAGALVWGSARRNHDYRSEETIWEDTLRKRPDSARAYGFYGTALLRAGKVDAAERHLSTAIRLNPNYVQGHSNLGAIQLGKGKVEEGIRSYRTALALKPNYALGHGNLGTALFQAGRREEAVECYRTAIRLRPRDVGARLNLGIVLAHLGRFDEALALFEGVAREQPDNPVALDNIRQVRALRTTQPPPPPR